MNAEFEPLSRAGDLLYLVHLTAQGVKPLSRWEMDLANEQRVAIDSFGLHVSTLTRSTEWGRLVSHTIFSRQRSLLQRHMSAFDGTAISNDDQTVRREGLDFGYPACCVDAFIEKGYQNNGLAAEVQAFLFHWACLDCEQTQSLLPDYRRIIERVCALRTALQLVLGGNLRFKRRSS